MTTFTFPFTIAGTATIDADHEGEALLTITKDLTGAVEEAKADPLTTTDNGAVVAFVGISVGDPDIATGDALALLRQAVEVYQSSVASIGGEINGGDFIDWFADFVADAANVLAGKAPGARPSVIDADLAEAASDDTCTACHRPSLDCSRAPCASVIVDRGDAESIDHAHDILADELGAWCSEQGLVAADADEMIHLPDLTPEQRTWLSTFILRWQSDGDRDEPDERSICPVCWDQRCDGCTPLDTPALDDSAHRHEMEV